MQDVNKELQSELSILVNHIRTNTKNKKGTHQMKLKISKLQKQQHILLERIVNLSRMMS
jgi:hypothetical protein